MKISDFAIKHPKVIMMLLIILFVFGLMSVFSLRRSLIADMNMPTLVVITTWPGVGPSDIEVEITNPLEESLGTLSGLKLMSSVSRNSVSVIELQLGYNEKAEDRLYEIREKINSAMPNLPDDLPSPPRILQYSTAELPIMTIIAKGEISRSELSSLCNDEIIPALSRVTGVANVSINGGSRDIAEINIDINRLNALQIPLLDITQILGAANFSLPGGAGIYQGYNLNIRTDGRYASLDDFKDQVLAFKDGHFIRLKDIADVEIREDRRSNYVISNGEDSLALSVNKQQDGDSILISREIRTILDSFEKEKSGKLSFSYIKDDAVNISMSVNSVLRSAVFGAALAVLVLFIFLHNTSATFMISFSIPLSILFTMLALWVKGSSLDLVTLGGMTAAIGMIIDASIVVLEMIQRHFNKGQLNASDAASLGVRETGQALIASMTTTLAAFFPVLFLTGLAGIILKDVAWTIIFAIFFSILAAIVVIPFLCSIFLKPEKEMLKIIHIFRKKINLDFSARMDRFMENLNNKYKNLLLNAIKNKFSFIAGTLILFILSLLSIRFLGFEFLAQTDMAEIVVSVETPGGYTLEMTRDKIIILEKTVREIIGNEMETSFYIAGQAGAFDMGNEPNRCYGTIRLKRPQGRKRHVTEIVNELNEKIKRMIPDVLADFRNGGLSNLMSMATGGEGLVVNVYGANLDAVVAASSQIRQYMLQDSNVVNTDIDIRFNQREMNTRLLHQYLGLLGLTSYEAALAGRIAFNGISLGTFYGKDKNYPIELRTSLGSGSVSDDVLYSLGINTRQGNQVSYANFAELEIEETISRINHRNKSRSITVSANLKDPNVRESTRRLENLINTHGIVPGASWELGGTAAEMLSSFRSLIVVLVLAIFLIYSVMVIQFERFTQPLLVMSSIPFTLIGITGGLLLFRSSLNLVSIMGIITLAGLVVNNAIILISYINLLRDKYGLPLEEAVITGSISRLKPILMTTITTLFGIIPLSLATGEGSEIYAPLGQSIFGGLFSSTFITLFFIPVVYLMLEKRREK
ncbi:MAG: efflux RND transporter permease subunit [Treponema sp.]|nr:efflux RND transporter permease subunit [Treponema sp.]MCL2272017.1 efflux RND transporter permease subunit [Treponema sp.]